MAAPQKVTQQKSKAALEGNAALKFMLSKHGRQKIMKDVSKDGQGKTMADYIINDSQYEQNGSKQGNSQINRKSAMIGQPPDMSEPEKPSIQIPHSAYMNIKNMTPEQKEEHYLRMGIPTNIKRKRLYFRSCIMLFTPCITKHFKLEQVFLQDSEEYGGLMETIHKFQGMIIKKIRDHPKLGGQPRLQIQQSKTMKQHGIFGGESTDITSDSQSQDYTLEFMQEINDYILKGIYKSILGSTNHEMSKLEAEYQKKQDSLADWVTPADFGIPEEQINEVNMPMWQKAIRELQKFEKFSSPSVKLKYLLSAFMIVNNSFSLFSSPKDDQAASADDILLIFPYIVVKAKINKLIRHIKFIRMFEYKELLVAEKQFVLSKLEISTKIILDFESEKLKKIE